MPVYSSISTIYADWLAEEGRTAGDKAYFANSATTTTRRRA